MDKQSDLSEIPRAQRRPPTKYLQYYENKHQDRNMGIIAAYKTGDYTMKEIANHFEVHYSTVSRAIKKIENA